MERKTHGKFGVSNQEVTADLEYQRELYKAKAVYLLKKGLIGFIIGFVIMIVIAGEKIIRDFPMTLLYAFVFMGIPYGWELLGRSLGHTLAVGSIPFMLIIYVLQFLGAALLGWIVYPFALLYNSMKAQKQGSVSKVVLTTLFALYVGFFAFMCVTLMIQGSQSEENKNTANQDFTTAAYMPASAVGAATEPEISLIADAAYIDTTSEEFAAIQTKALEYSRLEAEKAAEYSEIMDAPAIHAACFVNIKQPGETHYNFGQGKRIENAIVVFTCYTQKLMGTDTRENSQIWVFPDCSLDETGRLNHSEENEYRESVSNTGFEQTYEWFCEEYSDMTITELILTD